MKEGEKNSGLVNESCQSIINSPNSIIPRPRWRSIILQTWYKCRIWSTKQQVVMKARMCPPAPLLGTGKFLRDQSGTKHVFSFLCTKTNLTMIFEPKSAMKSAIWNLLYEICYMLFEPKSAKFVRAIITQRYVISVLSRSYPKRVFFQSMYDQCTINVYIHMHANLEESLI